MSHSNSSLNSTVIAHLQCNTKYEKRETNNYSCQKTRINAQEKDCNKGYHPESAIKSGNSPEFDQFSDFHQGRNQGHNNNASQRTLEV